MIPEHLLRFDLHIKIYDIRKFRNLNSKYNKDKSIGKDNNPYILQENQSVIIYVLHDCNLNFFNSKNISNDILVAGYNIGMPSISNLSFDIFFKSVSKRMEAKLRPNSLTIHNKEKALFKLDNINDRQYFSNQKNDDSLADYDMQNLFKYNPSEVSKEFTTASLYKKPNIIESGINTLVDKVKNTVIQKIKEKRNELINRFFGQIEDKTQIKKRIPEGNVYDDSYRNQSRIDVNSLKSRVINDVENYKNSVIQEGKLGLNNLVSNFDKKIGF